MSTLYVCLITVNDGPRRGLDEEAVVEHLSNVLTLGVRENIEVTVQTVHPTKGPTTVHVRGGRVRTERGSRLLVSEESHDPSAPTDASRKSHTAGDHGVADC